VKTAATASRALAASVLALLLAGAAPAAAGSLVLFDEGHRQAFVVGRDGELDLSGLGTQVRGAGATVRTNTGALDDAALAGAGALVISGAFAPLGPAEVAAVMRFVERGGRLAVMLHIGPPVQPLIEALGLQYSRAPLHEAEGVLNPRGTDFTVTRFERHELTDGLASMAVFGCFVVRSTVPGDRILARTGPRSWPDTDGNGRPSGGEPVGSHGVVVAGARGRGQFAVFGDDAIFQNRFLAAYNSAPGARLARWLAGGRGAAPPPPARQAPRTIPL